jgi:chemotaxis regulatin CheY-phosphate phosphatase CheZ
MHEQSHNPREKEKVDNVIGALQRVIGLLDRTKLALEESSGKIPKASSQLDNVTQATESVTIEILNAIDALSSKLDVVESGFAYFKNLPLDQEGQETITLMEQTLGAAKEDSMNIAMSLQVQDITAQKIAAANHLIESVRLDLLHELDSFSSHHPIPAELRVRPTGNNGNGAFDTNASYHKDPRHQAYIDQVFLRR